MNAKEYLSQAWYLDKRIKTKERQLDWLRSHAAYVSPKISDEPKVSASGRRSPVEEAVVRIVELERDINDSIAKLMRLKTEIADAIRSVNSMECETLLEMRYLAFLAWDQIASQLNYSQNYIYHLHRKALGLVRVPGA
jgi:DNA-directed RNA polymerase specialized sigma subunit